MIPDACQALLKWLPARGHQQISWRLSILFRRRMTTTWSIMPMYSQMKTFMFSAVFSVQRPISAAGRAHRRRRFVEDVVLQLSDCMLATTGNNVRLPAQLPAHHQTMYTVFRRVHGALSLVITNVESCLALCDQQTRQSQVLSQTFLWAVLHKDVTVWRKSDRSVSLIHGPHVGTCFSHKHGIDLVCRAHQEMEQSVATCSIPFQCAASSMKMCRRSIRARSSDVLRSCLHV